MSHGEYFRRRFRFQRVLEGLHIPRPSPGFYLQALVSRARSTLAAPAEFGCYYLLAASDVRRHSGIVEPASSWRSTRS